MSEKSTDRRSGDGPDALVSAEEDRFAWRRKIKSNPTTRVAYRVAVAVVGLVIVALGIAAIPLPGPGWLIVFLGLGVWASEFDWAANLLEWVKDKVTSWTRWVGRQAWWVQALVTLATIALVLAIFWALFAVSGVPGFFPDGVKDWLNGLPGIG
ncbi:TIGR02611 family protein [Luteipulveratus sp. YIM 133132]|uniref:TIGR02611 family protein n=1 Tax=Luteipulveratus flavus TaxID=3031728 RepID=A0ABT6C4W5_9MICO|nr:MULTISPECIES: TIGR02611 family protein [unclassified Luteipulveratus]MDE9364450.1 TIGR02611 family protein [Luteipulveratus sp. YIM 133132]MDF8263989.1 TIGR02611 family protein [Luteipulveratus sp. YIM 133296]